MHNDDAKKEGMPMTTTEIATMLKNLTALILMGEAGLERADVVRQELSRQQVDAKKIRDAVRKGTRQHLLELQKFASWGQEDKADAVAALLRRIPELSPDEILNTRNRGKKIAAALTRFEQQCRLGQNQNEIQELHAQLLRKYPFLKVKLDKIMNFSAKKRDITKRNKELKQAGQPLSSVQSKGVHAIGALTPCAVWDLLIDESGQDYGADATGKQAGKIVGVLVPGATNLPNLQNFHSTSATPERVDRALQTLLDHQVGIFGISIRDIPRSAGERWMDGVCEVIHWVWQQLPLDPRMVQTRLNVFIENRADFTTAVTLRALERELLRQWAAVDPTRTVKLSLQFVSKDGHKYLGYADAVAFTWGSPAQESKVRLRQSGLLGECLQEIGSGVKLRNLRDFFARPELMDGDYWKWLSSLDGITSPYSLSGQVLNRLAEHCRKDARKWDELVEALFQYLEGKALDLLVLGRQGQWLEDCRPQARALPKTVELMLLVSKLANKNHLGATDCEPLTREVTELGDRLLAEDARLVCRADLHLAVNSTNSFQFDLASRYIERWLDMLGLSASGEDSGSSVQAGMGTMILGLQLAGRIKSTLGQHLAFQGHHSHACAMFLRAIQDFNRLSDKNSAARDVAQTGTYLAIASMDDPACPPELVRTRMEEVLGPLDLAVNKLAHKVDPALKYSHHLLLRYLTQCDDVALSLRYLDAAKDMPYEYGHPWELIQFYRVWLARRHNREVNADTMSSILSLAFDEQQGPTVSFIGLAMALALGRLDSFADATRRKLAVLRHSLPGAHDRITLLENYLTTPPADGLTALRELLPFNFR